METLTLSKEICNICMEADLMQEINGVVKPCSHNFCFICIEKWLKCKSTCPNCMVLVTKVCKIVDNIQEEIETKDLLVLNEKSEISENFDCLDHEYFRKEISNLEKRLNKIILTLSIAKNDFKIEQKWKIIEDLKERIKTKNEIVKNLEQFNSEQFLIEIYDIDSLFIKIEFNKWAEILMEHFIDQKWYDDKSTTVDNYDDDYYYDDYDYKDYDQNDIHTYGGKIYFNQQNPNSQKVSNSKKKKNKKK